MSLEGSFWNGRRVFLTGHTGFKGSWLSIWLDALGANITGYSLAAPTEPNLFDLSGFGSKMNSITGDIQDGERIRSAMASVEPEIVIHMAAQAIVREGYRDPIGTYATNVMGTANVLEAARSCPSIRAIVVVTTDKCYENNEWHWGYRENDRLGGFDPYSSSKACAEIVAAAYRRSFFSSSTGSNTPALATARAGNVIGGGDWAKDRLIPDFIRAIESEEPIKIRNPQAIRPWQHVLEPLSGYLTLARALYENGAEFAEAWNFGPDDADARPVEWIVERLCGLFENSRGYIVDQNPQPHEASYLKLDCSKSKARLRWRQRWTLDQALSKIANWNRALWRGEDMAEVTRRQIAEYSA